MLFTHPYASLISHFHSWGVTDYQSPWFYYDNQHMIIMFYVPLWYIQTQAELDVSSLTFFEQRFCHCNLYNMT